MILAAMRASWFVVGLIGCAEIPQELGFDDGALSTFVDGDTGASIVEGPGYELVFGPGGPNSIPMPDKLTIGPEGNQRDVLTLATPECAFEARVGLALFPGLDISSVPDRFGAGGMATTSKISLEHEGPGMVQYKVEYAVNYASGPRIATFAGETIFTFFATGQIVRFDQFEPFAPGDGALMGPVMPFGCATGPAGSFFLTSYWAFENSDPTTMQLQRGDVPVADGSPEACTFYPERQTMIGVVWPGDGQNVRYAPGGNSAGHVFDFVGGNGTVMPGSRQVSSKLFIQNELSPPDACGGVLNELTDAGMLLINDMPFPKDQHGIYHELDDQPHDSTITLTSTGRLPAGVAVLLNLGDLKHAEVLKEDGSEPPAYVQQFDDELVLFVLRDELLAGETVTIEPF